MKIATRILPILFAVAAVAAAGCGSDDGDGSSTVPKGGRASPGTESALLAILNYGRAADASEVCPLLSTDYAKQIGGGDASKCASAGETVLCPCVSTPLQTSSLNVEGDTATAKVLRPRTGTTQTITLVQQNGAWKIDKLDPPKA